MHMKHKVETLGEAFGSVAMTIQQAQGAELICEIQSPNQWLFDVTWCPRNPAIFSSSSFDGHVSIYSLMGGQQQAIPTTNKKNSPKMRVKDLERTVNVAWSPANHHPILLATGTAAQQLDASFSTSSALELFSLNLSDPGADMDRVAIVPTEQRFHQLVWGSGVGAAGDSGIIIGGCDGGLIQVFSPTKMMAGQEPLLARKEGHKGAVKALDLNPFQTNLLASGASDSEIFIWDLEQMGNPMTPGATAQPPDAVSWLSWNRQVQHILASTFPSRCVVWDLRKNEPIIKLVDTTSHVRWRSVNWHPDVATQLCLASEDDMNPVVQLWDLRFATSPLKSLSGHTRGVTCIAWCMHDPDLLLSCARDNRILCWNPNEATPIADSFPGMESFAPAQVMQQTHVHTAVDLRKPPKWLRKPAGVSFAFGSDQPGRVSVSQMVSEPLLLEKAAKLENAMTSGQESAFCAEQATTASTPHLRTLWHFLSAEFSQDPRSEVLSLLGYPADEFSAKINSVLGNTEQINQLASDVSGLNVGDVQKTDDSSNFDLLTDGSQYNGTNPEGLIGQALLLGHTEAAVELCLKQGRMADALLLAMTGGPDLLARTQFRYFEKSKGWLSRIISAVVTEDWNGVVSSCSTASWKQALAAAITHTQGEDFFRLCQSLGERLESEEITGLSQNAQVCYLCSGNIEKLVQSWTTSGAPTDPLQIQELVQVVVLLQAASRHQGTPSQSSLALAQLLTNYAFYLASQGSFTTALGYLENAHEEAAMELKDRLQQSLDNNNSTSSNQWVCIINFQTKEDAQVSIPTYNQSRSRTVSQSSYDGYGGHAAPFVPPPPVSASPQPPTDTSFMQPSYNAPTTTPPAAVSKPARKYVADPSVQNPYGNSYSSNAYAPSSNMYGAQQSPFMPSSQLAGPPTSNMYNPSVAMDGPVPTLYKATSAPPPTQRQTRLVQSNDLGPPGWNDPPPLSVQQPKPEYVQQSPITHPLFGSMPQEQQPPPSSPGQLNGQMYAPPMQPAYNSPQTYPTSYSPQILQPQFLQPAMPPAAPAQVAEPPKPKPAIPEAYAHLPQIFDELRDRCANAAGNPLTRRKLEDVARKMEAMYDLIREYKLHTQMVSGADFTQISSFMPGLKVLLQTSMQLGVYLQQ
ncbi:hypothetical protein B566_EDAN007807 [Ephemera danica]|nr:hypothetical protein B566_EDAN007807 [Ephemera danica]